MSQPADEKSSLVTTFTGFPLYSDIKIQGLFNDFQGPLSCIFMEQFWTEVYSKDSITEIFNVYFCDDGTVLLDKN